MWFELWVVSVWKYDCAGEKRGENIFKNSRSEQTLLRTISAHIQDLTLRTQHLNL